MDVIFIIAGVVLCVAWFSRPSKWVLDMAEAIGHDDMVEK